MSLFKLSPWIISLHIYQWLQRGSDNLLSTAEVCWVSLQNTISRFQRIKNSHYTQGQFYGFSFFLLILQLGLHTQTHSRHMHHKAGCHSVCPEPCRLGKVMKFMQTLVDAQKAWIGFTSPDVFVHIAVTAAVTSRRVYIVLCACCLRDQRSSRCVYSGSVG